MPARCGCSASSRRGSDASSRFRSAPCSVSARSSGISCRRATRSSCSAASTKSTARAPAADRRAVSVFELGALVDTPVRQLSLGERMRCEIAASLLHSPRMLFLDEPTIGLDVSAKAAIRELLRTESERERVTLLLTSHDTGDMERVCKRAIVINRGRLLWDGAIAGLCAAAISRRSGSRSGAKRSASTLTLPGVRVLSSGVVPDGVRNRARDHVARPGGRRRAAPGRHPRHGDRGRAARRGDSGAVCDGGRGACRHDGRAMPSTRRSRASRRAQRSRERGDVRPRGVLCGHSRRVLEPVARGGRGRHAGRADPKALVWYLAATEWIVLSAPPIHVEIQEAIRRGDVVYRLGVRSRTWLPSSRAARRCWPCALPLLGLTAFVCAFAFTGWIPPADGARCRRAVRVGGRRAAGHGAVLGIGLLAFWLQDVSPVFWVWQKLMFVLGGLMLPLSLYPAIQRVAAFTPFPTLLAGPASFMLANASRRPAGWLELVTLERRDGIRRWPGFPARGAREIDGERRWRLEHSVRRALFAMNLKAALAERGAFALQVLFMMLNNVTFFVFWWALMPCRPARLAARRHSDPLRHRGHGIRVTVVFAGGVRYLGRFIHEGELDTLLTQPRPVCSTRSDAAAGVRPRRLHFRRRFIAASGDVSWREAPIVLVAIVASALDDVRAASCSSAWRSGSDRNRVTPALGAAAHVLALSRAALRWRAAAHAVHAAAGRLRRLLAGAPRANAVAG